ncbi:MAG: hypothetical protein P8X94_03925 [Woeseiaceae bacterium]
MTTHKDQERVSAAYRDLAKESTPPALDRRILDVASREGRSRYGIVRTWMRPVAWAATIGLSLAILLEITVFSDAPPSHEQQTAPGAPPAERARRDADVMRAKEADAMRQSAPQRASAAAPDSGREVAAPAACDPEARMTAESWLACIEALRDQERDEEAAAELAALRDAFPDAGISPAR